MSHDFRSKFLSAIDKVIAPPQSSTASARGLERVIGRLQSKLSRVNGKAVAIVPPAILPSPTPSAAFAIPSAAASHTSAAPSTALLKALADAIFGKGTAASECKLPWPQASEATRSLLTETMHQEFQHKAASAQADREILANTPSPAQIEKFERTKLTELFYKSGVDVPGLDFSGLNISAGDFGKIELTESQLKVAQERCDDFFGALAGKRFHDGNVAVEAARRFLAGDARFPKTLTVPPPEGNL